MKNNINFIETQIDDLNDILEIYNYYIERTTVTFDYERINLDELNKRLFLLHDRYKTYLVYINNELIGFCFLSQFRKKEAYNKTAEIGLYLKQQFTGKGFGKKIIIYLENNAKGKFDMLVASVSGDNDQSKKLYKKLGYKQCAHYKDIAVKFGRKVDIIDYQKSIL